MIEKLIHQSRTTEIDAAAGLITGAFETSRLKNDSYLSVLIPKLLSLRAGLSAAINQMTAESDLEEKDLQRDDKVRALFYLLQGYLYHPDLAIRKAAKTLTAVLDQYGLAIIGESYATESSLINSLLKELSKPKLQEAIAVLSGCAQLITALQTAQNEFEAARLAYEGEKADESKKESATTIKKEVVKLINSKLVVYLRAMVQVDEAAYSEFARTVAEIIESNNETVKRRRKKVEPAE